MNPKFQVLTTDKEIHFQIDPTITYFELRAEMKELIEKYQKAKKACYAHSKPENHAVFKSLKDPEYLKWFKEKRTLDKEESLAHGNMATLARDFCPQIYIV